MQSSNKLKTSQQKSRMFPLNCWATNVIEILLLPRGYLRTVTPFNNSVSNRYYILKPPIQEAVELCIHYEHCILWRNRKRAALCVKTHYAIFLISVLGTCQGTNSWKSYVYFYRIMST